MSLRERSLTLKTLGLPQLTYDNLQNQAKEKGQESIKHERHLAVLEQWIAINGVHTNARAFYNKYPECSYLHNLNDGDEISRIKPRLKALALSCKRISAISRINSFIFMPLAFCLALIQLPISMVTDVIGIGAQAVARNDDAKYKKIYAMEHNFHELCTLPIRLAFLIAFLALRVIVIIGVSIAMAIGSLFDRNKPSIQPANPDVGSSLSAADLKAGDRTFAASPATQHSPGSSALDQVVPPPFKGAQAAMQKRGGGLNRLAKDADSLNEASKNFAANAKALSEAQRRKTDVIDTAGKALAARLGL